MSWGQRAVDLHALKTILYRHQGVRHAISARELALLMDLRERDNRSIREGILELIKQGVPIGSIPKEGGGYFWIQSARELEQATADYRARARQLYARISALERAYNLSQVTQPVLL